MNFPEEVVTEILSRLPVKSLLRFKCVSKSWCIRISAKDFTFSHLNNYKPSDVVLVGLQRGKPTNLSIAKVSPPPTIAFAEERAAAAAALPFVSKIVNFPLPKEYKDWTFAADVCGPCNGIFCLYQTVKGRILLWNPLIHDFRIVPRSNLPRQSVRPLVRNYIVGFGFDSETNDYKILQIVKSVSINQQQQQQFELYSLGTNSWRKLDASPLNTFCISRHLFTAYRKIVWLGMERRIHLFDVCSETFDMIPISLEGENDSIATILQVFPFRESIAVVISATAVPSPSGYCEIWMLNDFNCARSRSWSKLWTIALENLCNPLGFCGNSYLICQGRQPISDNVMLYDLLNHHVVDVGASMAKKALVYKESLISISGNKRNEKIEMQVELTRLKEVQEEELSRLKKMQEAALTRLKKMQEDELTRLKKVQEDELSGLKMKVWKMKLFIMSCLIFFLTIWLVKD